MVQLQFRVDNIENVNSRLDKFIYNNINQDEDLGGLFSRTQIQNLIENGYLMRNNQIFSNNAHKIQLGEEYNLFVPNPTEWHLEPQNIPLNIVYEDDDLLVINKQANLVTHPGCNNLSETLANALLFYCKDKLSGIGGIYRPGIVHRLDKDTTGLMVVAKNDLAHISLSEQIQNRSLKRVYNAIIWGNIFPKNGRIEGYMNKCPTNRLKMQLNKNADGKFSATNYNVIKEFGSYATLVECRLDTGRTHQIRVHFSHNKHPLIGDQLYCDKIFKINLEENQACNFINTFPRQALHSKTITFSHPRTREIITLDSELPEDIHKLISSLEELSK